MPLLLLLLVGGVVALGVSSASKEKAPIKPKAPPGFPPGTPGHDDIIDLPDPPQTAIQAAYNTGIHPEALESLAKMLDTYHYFKAAKRLRDKASSLKAVVIPTMLDIPVASPGYDDVINIPEPTRTMVTYAINNGDKPSELNNLAVMLNSLGYHKAAARVQQRASQIK